MKKQYHAASKADAMIGVIKKTLSFLEINLDISFEVIPIL
jgi:hypothetical protein